MVRRLLALPLRRLGRGLPGRVVRPGHALPPRTHEEGGPHAPPASAAALNWFRARGEISAAIVEGFNNKAKLTTRKAYGFRSYRCLEIALYHTLGQLPEPEATHRFC